MKPRRRLPGPPALPILLAGLILLLALSWPASRAAAAAGQDIFTVADVPVDATAANAVAARDAARLDGERRAFRQLLERLTLAADRGRLPRVGDQQLTDMVRDFEVANERSSGIRYLATYTFRFRPDAVRTLLRDAGIPFVETVSKPVIVLPILRHGDTTVLWDDANPWRAAWSDRSGSGGLVPLVVPLGDAADLAAINADQALAADPAALTRIAAHNGGGDILIAAATQAAGGELQTSLRRVSTTGTSEIAKASFQPNSGENDDAFMARAVAASIVSLEDAWRRDNVLTTSSEGVLTAAVPLNGGLADWLAVRDRLKGVPTVKRSDVLALGRQEGRIELHYLGDPARLRVALAQRDLVLDGSEDSWTLRPRSSAAPPPDEPPR
jgi:hypothetical protein